MVSLFDISTQRPLWAGLTTGVPSLDALLPKEASAILDLQSVPASAAFLGVVVNLMVSHLVALSELRVVVLEALDTFCWLLLTQHPQFDERWLDGRVTKYATRSFAQIYAFFTFMPLANVAPGSVLMVLWNFHEVVEMYRVQLSAAYEETLLRHEINDRRVLWANRDKVKEEGLALVPLFQLPQSSKLGENPIVRAQNHINELFKRMGQFAYKHSAVIALQGHLDLKFKPWTRQDVSLDPLTSQNQSFSEPKRSGRLIFHPMQFGYSGSDTRSSRFCDSQITARFVFYNDWYHKSPHFQRELREPHKEDLYFVTAVKAHRLRGVSNINDPVYFDFKYAPGKSGMTGSWFIDLLEQETSDLSALIQNSLSLTQVYKATGRVPINISSSPPFTRSQAGVDIDAEMGNADADLLVISGSDVELTGTLLDEIDNEPDWLARHS